mmetsp:Transcript_10264/g.20118  ORF Transcript_10264/g.20118 Transcript_10264/m.20118 type:complete len:280 (-) Transcript_10264:231-1070(-)|eukprot:CAMPEP_0171503238 /NCGR_PEP_ID=MMETSP0958-20121227/10749_1 /TAXON_ID=87120 /ORGANISM="Aurantiochytrium limacinum, Strain ATCCMYA-1381" /LENGTH=279 /DNA_ID=CAMNT_0012038635 /DNA_START=30 /DNA_END=869 /DNA_ORIENTATION=+
MPKALQGENDVESMAALPVGTLFGVENQVVVITGGGSGIGAMIAMGFVANKAKVYIVSRKDTSDFASEIQSIGSGKCISLRADLGTDAGVAAFAEEITRLEPNGIDVLINNSGTNWGQPIEQYGPEAWDKVYALNVKGVFNLTRLLIPSLEKSVARRNLPARIINISSIDSLRVPALDTYAYSSGKAAVTHLSKVLAGKLGDRRILCNAVCPGPFPSRMMRGTIERASEEAVASGTAIGRLGMPGDMAGVCIFLASEAGSFVTGATIAVDGGAVVKPRM